MEKLRAAAQRLQVSLAWLLSGEHDRPAPSGAVDAAAPEASGGVAEMDDTGAAAPNWWRLPPTLLESLACRQQDARIFHVRTAAMEPTINRSGYVMVDLSQRTLHEAQIYVIHNELSLIVRRAHVVGTARGRAYVELSSDGSPRVERVQITRIRIIGRVVAQLLRPL